MRLPSATRLLADGIVQVLRALARLTSCELIELAEEVGCARYVKGAESEGPGGCGLDRSEGAAAVPGGDRGRC